MRLWHRIANTFKPGAEQQQPTCPAQTPRSVRATTAASSAVTLHQLAPYEDLITLMDTRQQIELTATRMLGEIYSTMVLHLDFSQQQLWLDKVPGFPVLAGGDQIRLRHHLRGYVLDVVTTVREQTTDAIAVDLPTNAQYRLRRQAPRVSLRPESPIMIKLKSFYYPVWDGTVRNLSCQGARIALPGNKIEQLQRVKHIPWLEIAISRDLVVRCEANIVGYQLATKPYRHTCVSLAFDKMRPDTRAQLNEFVIGLLGPVNTNWAA